MNVMKTQVGLSLVSLCLLASTGIVMPPVYAKTSPDKARVQKLRTTGVKKHVVKLNQAVKKDIIQLKAEKILENAVGLNQQVLELALVAHGNAKRKGQTDKQILTVVDYSLPSTQKRIWVINLINNEVLFHDYVAHGVNSGGKYTTNFSNEEGSRSSSFGVFLTSNTYHGKHGYSLRLDGLEEDLNHNARRRAIVMHGGTYVSTAAINTIGRLGRSWGCFTLRQHLNKPVIDTVRNKTVIFAYYPNFKWLATSRYLNKKLLLR